MTTQTQPSMSEDHDWDKVDDVDDTPLLSTEEEEATDETTTIQTTEKTPSPPSTPKDEALQIVSIGTETDQYAFTFHEETLQSILEQIPCDTKVCVVSVVGAFRTGKSFLLSWFLRYLAHFESVHQENNKEEAGVKWFDKHATLGKDAFHWRGGAERNTTGIWMWSKPYILPQTHSGGKEDIAVVLVDTQGMFDHETTMELTASIFGLSTLLSSYQIYNVDKRIQEDNLQQLALFAEYGRMAIQNDGKVDLDSVKASLDHDGTEEKEKEKGGAETSDDKKDIVGKEEENKDTEQVPTPFQQIEFLVRDWQNFEEEEDFEACEREMEEYLENVLAEREAADLKDTREQITSCFEKVKCYLMVHPGRAVTKKKYDGDIDSIDPLFKEYMQRYCTRVFEHLIPKAIHGRDLTALELGSYIQNYAKMFESGAHFPEASTMLDATSNANNTNAQTLSIKKYKDKMDVIAGSKQSNYMKRMSLEEFHNSTVSLSMRTFDDVAQFGNKKAIERKRCETLEEIMKTFEMYTELNESRNPLAGFETYIIPLTIGIVSITVRWTTDWTCSSWSQTCKASSDFFHHVYQVVFFFLVIIAATKAKQVSEAAGRIKGALIAVQGGNMDIKKKNE